MNKIGFIALLLGGSFGFASPSATAPVAAEPQSISQAFHHVDQVLTSLIQQIEAKHPGYRESLATFNAHLKTCSSFTLIDPVHQLTQRIQGWQGSHCRVEVDSTRLQQQALCLYTASDLGVTRLGLQTPFTHASCRQTEWVSAS